MMGRLVCCGLAAVQLLLTGCATFRGGMVGPVEPWPPAASSQRKTVAVTFRMDRVMEMGPNRGPVPVGDDELSQFRGKVWAEFQDSGLFSDVKTGLEDADLRADVRFFHRSRGSIGLAILSGLTFMMIPLKATVDEFEITTTFKDRDGNVLLTIEKKEKLNTWFQLFLVFVAPFKNILTESNAAIRDLIHSTLNEAVARKIT